MNLRGLVSISFFIFLFSIFAFAADSHTILLKARAFTPKVVSLTFSDLAQYSGRHVLVQFEDTPTAAERKEISARGVKLLQPIPYNAYIAFIEQKDWAKEKALTPFRWVGNLSPKDKVHPRIQLGELDVHVIGDDGLATFYVYCHEDVSKDRCSQVLENIGAEVLTYTPALNMFLIRIEPYRYEEIAELDEVMWIAEPTPLFGLYNNKARAAVGADIAHGAPYFTTGAGVKVLIYDGGYVLNTDGNATHPDLAGRVIYPETFPAPDLYGHATHVSCTVAGTGAASGGTYQGMGPNVAQIVSMAYTAMLGPIFYNNLGDMEDNYTTAINLGAQVANNSIGSNVAINGFNCAWEGDYEGSAALIDKLVYGIHGPIIIVWANGNERGGEGRCGKGYGTVPPPCPAKNTIAVGATYAEDDQMTTFSSWGPTDDGRIRPDVVAPGDSHDGGIKSCSYGSGYLKMSGTSMASPVTTGCVTLAVEMWQRTMGTPNPPPYLMKALIIHGADDLGTPGPDYVYGYGRVYIPRTLDLISLHAFLDFTLEQGQTFVRRFKVSGAEPFKVTLVWTDPAGPILSGKDLVNDLNLSVIAPDSSLKLPFVLNPANPEVPATAGIDNTNPVEQVLIENPTAGVYEVKVDGTYVPQGPQSAAIVFSGGEACAEEEICDNEIDDNCDGQIDEGCGQEEDDDEGGGGGGGCGC